VAGRISEAIDIFLLKAETTAIIVGMMHSITANPATGETTPTTRRRVAVCNQNGRQRLGEKFFTPNGRNPLKSPDSKK
jgi:hypothetical protein